MKEEKKPCAFGIASLILGIIGISTIWLIYLPFANPFIFPVTHSPIGIIAMVFGTVGYFYRKEKCFAFCLIGSILGLLTGIIGLIGFMFRVFGI